MEGHSNNNGSSPMEDASPLSGAAAAAAVQPQRMEPDAAGQGSADAGSSQNHAHAPPPHLLPDDAEDDEDEEQHSQQQQQPHPAELAHHHAPAAVLGGGMAPMGGGEDAAAASPGCSLRETRMERRPTLPSAMSSSVASASHSSWFSPSFLSPSPSTSQYNWGTATASFGGLHSGLTVFTWGRGEDGQLGLGDASDQEEPTYVDSLRGVGVRQIACGSGHTVVLTTEGHVYTWGRGDDGRLGHGENMWKYVPRIIQSLVGPVLVQVTCGSYHTAAVTAQGDLYTWGGGMYGKLGHGTEAGASTPQRVQAMVGLPVSQIACGSRHTAVVTGTGIVYTWGDRENGVAGHGETEGHQYEPRRLERLAHKRVAQISACGFHTAAVTDGGELYTWGEGKFGRLGHFSERNGHVPQLVESLLGKKPRQVSCGGFHTAVVTEEGRLYTFGGGEHGQLGHNDRVNKLKPTLVQALEGIFVTQITCGWSHSVALTAKGRVYTWYVSVVLLSNS